MRPLETTPMLQPLRAPGETRWLPVPVMTSRTATTAVEHRRQFITSHREQFATAARDGATGMLGSRTTHRKHIAWKTSPWCCGRHQSSIFETSQHNFWCTCIPPLRTLKQVIVKRRRETIMIDRGILGSCSFTRSDRIGRVILQHKGYRVYDPIKPVRPEMNERAGHAGRQPRSNGYGIFIGSVYLPLFQSPYNQNEITVGTRTL